MTQCTIYIAPHNKQGVPGKIHAAYCPGAGTPNIPSQRNFSAPRPPDVQRNKIRLLRRYPAGRSNAAIAVKASLTPPDGKCGRPELSPPGADWDAMRRHSEPGGAAPRGKIDGQEAIPDDTSRRRANHWTDRRSLCRAGRRPLARRREPRAGGKSSIGRRDRLSLVLLRAGGHRHRNHPEAPPRPSLFGLHGRIGPLRRHDRQGPSLALDDQRGRTVLLFRQQARSDRRHPPASRRRCAQHRCGLHADQPALSSRCLRQPRRRLRSGDQRHLCGELPEEPPRPDRFMAQGGREVPLRSAGAKPALFRPRDPHLVE